LGLDFSSELGLAVAWLLTICDQFGEMSLALTLKQMKYGHSK